MYYSQFNEDKILSEIFRSKSSGICIEVGANDGINDSTTLFFERLEWNCILVEPNPGLCQHIRSTRQAILYECAASDKNGISTLYIAEGADRAHGVSMLSEDRTALKKINSYGFTGKPVQVITRKLDDILTDIKLKDIIDFITIDVEGHELEVLKGFSVEKWMPTVIILEDNSNFENVVVRNYLRKYGYIRFKRTGVNDWYAYKKNRNLINLVNRTQYIWLQLKVKTKNRLKKVPLVLTVWRLLKKLTN
jgi:FkbM family methyltransferase